MGEVLHSPRWRTGRDCGEPASWVSNDIAPDQLPGRGGSLVERELRPPHGVIGFFWRAHPSARHIGYRGHRPAPKVDQGIRRRSPHRKTADQVPSLVCDGGDRARGFKPPKREGDVPVSPAWPPTGCGLSLRRSRRSRGQPRPRRLHTPVEQAIVTGVRSSISGGCLVLTGPAVRVVVGPGQELLDVVAGAEQRVPGAAGKHQEPDTAVPLDSRTALAAVRHTNDPSRSCASGFGWKG